MNEVDWWGSWLMRKFIDEKVNWWERWLMRKLIAEKVDWLESQMMRKLIDKKGDWWESQLMRKLIDEKVNWWDSWLIRKEIYFVWLMKGLMTDICMDAQCLLLSCYHDWKVIAWKCPHTIIFQRCT